MNTFTEWSKLYGPFYQDWENMQNCNLNEWDGWERYGLKSAGQAIGRGLLTAGNDLGRAGGKLAGKLLSAAKLKADALMKIGMDKLQKYLETKNLGWLLPTLKKYQKPLLLLGIIAAGGLLAYSMMPGQDPAVLAQQAGIPVDQWKLIDPQTQQAILHGNDIIKQVTTDLDALSAGIDQLSKNITVAKIDKVIGK